MASSVVEWVFVILAFVLSLTGVGLASYNTMQEKKLSDQLQTITDTTMGPTGPTGPPGAPGNGENGGEGKIGPTGPTGPPYPVLFPQFYTNTYVIDNSYLDVYKKGGFKTSESVREDYFQDIGNGDLKCIWPGWYSVNLIIGGPQRPMANGIVLYARLYKQTLQPDPFYTKVGTGQLKQVLLFQVDLGLIPESPTVSQQGVAMVECQVGDVISIYWSTQNTYNGWNANVYSQFGVFPNLLTN